MAASRKPRGRPRTFATEQLLPVLVEVFASKGYTGVALQDITELTGINRSSLYNTFGSKDELFKLVLQHYVEQRSSTVLVVLEHGTAGLSDIVDFVRDSIDHMTGPGRNVGCLLANTTADLDPENPLVGSLIDEFHTSLRDALSFPLRRSVELGEIDAAMIDVYSNAISLSIYAIVLAIRAQMPQPKLERQVALLVALIESWRI